MPFAPFSPPFATLLPPSDRGPSVDGSFDFLPRSARVTGGSSGPTPQESWNASRIYTDTAGTTLATTAGQSVKCWRGVNGTTLTDIGSFFPTYRPDAAGAGLHAVRLDNGVLLGSALSASLDRRNHALVIVYARRDAGFRSVVNVATTVGNFNNTAGHLTNGYQRPEMSGVTGCEYGTPLTGFWVIGISSSGTGVRWCVNGRLADTGTSLLTAGSFPAISVGAFPGAANFAAGDLARLDLHGVTLSDADLRAAVLARMSEYGITLPVPAANLIFTGNSITYGLSCSYNPFTSVAAAAAGVSGNDYRAFGRSGIQTAAVRTADASQWAGWYRPGTPNVAVLWELTNSLAQGGQTPAAALASHAQWVADARAAGFKVVAPTVVNRTSFFSGTDAAGFATAQGTVNGALLANSGGIYGDVIVDLSSVAATGTAGDGTHPVQAGHTSIGGLVGTGVSTALAM